MKTIVGLFSNDEHIQRSICRLQEVGIAKDQIKVLAFESTVADLLHGRQSVTVAKYAGWGVASGVVFFVLYELIGRICDCGVAIYGFSVELDKLVLLIVVGAILGLLTGYLVGVKHLEGSIRLYTWNVHQGDKMVAVQVSDEMEADIINILHSENGVAIRTLETRLHHLLHPKSH